MAPFLLGVLAGMFVARILQRRRQQRDQIPFDRRLRR